MHTTRPKLEVISRIGTVFKIWSRNQITLIIDDDNGIHNRSDHSTYIEIWTQIPGSACLENLG